MLMFWGLCVSTHVSTVPTVVKQRVNGSLPSSLALHQALMMRAQEGLPRPWKRPLTVHRPDGRCVFGRLGQSQPQLFLENNFFRFLLDELLVESSISIQKRAGKIEHLFRLLREAARDWWSSTQAPARPRHCSQRWAEGPPPNSGTATSQRSRRWTAPVGVRLGPTEGRPITLEMFLPHESTLLSLYDAGNCQQIKKVLSGKDIQSHFCPIDSKRYGTTSIKTMVFFVSS